ncbi:MAG TPA: CsiV family protein [Gammaproteobacteria bacterium]|nr:CsiV family protein [Gammaproteobacteria bacterium]
MLRRFLSRSTLSLAILLCAAASAQAPAPPVPTGPPLFQVEVLIFAYRDFDPNEERFTYEAPPPRLDEERRPVPVLDESTLESLEPAPGALPQVAPPPDGAAPVPDEAGTSGFRLLRPEELQLNTEWRKLERVPTYVALAHGGWVQPGLPEDQAMAVDLALLGVMNPSGTVRVHLSRFLHIALDLTYRDTLHGAQASAPASGGGLAEVDIAPRYGLAAQRQTRSGELQYFDHPAFGVLVKVTPVQAPKSGTRPAA